LANSSTPFSAAGPSNSCGNPMSGVPPTSSAMLIGIRDIQPTTIMARSRARSLGWRPDRVRYELSEERTFEIRLPEGRLFVHYRGRPDTLKFAVMLQVPTDDGWRTVCLIDNAENKGIHIHRYEGARKLPSEPFHRGSAREGIPARASFSATTPTISLKHGETTSERSSRACTPLDGDGDAL
jgi:hypothetical protein